MKLFLAAAIILFALSSATADRLTEILEQPIEEMQTIREPAETLIAEFKADVLTKAINGNEEPVIRPAYNGDSVVQRLPPAGLL